MNATRITAYNLEFIGMVQDEILYFRLERSSHNALSDRSLVYTTPGESAAFAHEFEARATVALDALCGARDADNDWQLPAPPPLSLAAVHVV